MFVACGVKGIVNSALPSDSVGQHDHGMLSCLAFAGKPSGSCDSSSLRQCGRLKRKSRPQKM